MMNVRGTELTATLEDNATARDFATLLPLTLTLEVCRYREDQHPPAEALHCRSTAGHERFHR